MGLVSRLKHAFAVDPPGPAEPTPAQQDAVDRVCREVARRRMTTASLVGLEMFRPLNYVGSALMQFAAPGIWAITREQTYADYLHMAEFLERRGSIEYLSRRVEHFEEQYLNLERARRIQRTEEGQPETPANETEEMP